MLTGRRLTNPKRCSTAATIKKLAEKYERQRAYAEEYLGGFEHRFMFWSPVVRRGLVSELEKIGFELFINGKYKDAVNDLRARARKSTTDTNNPAFRMLQIPEHLRPT
jgi:hypothetical protein